MSTKDEIAERSAVMKLMSDGRPRTVGQVCKALGWFEARTEWALSVLIDLGEIVRTKGGKYGLVKKETPKLVSYKRGGLEAQVLDVMADGKTWTALRLAPECIVKPGRISTVLANLVRKDKVVKVSRGVYMRKGVPLSEGSPLPPTDPREVEVSAGSSIVGGVQVNVSICCKSLDELRDVMQALVKAMKGAAK